MTLRVLKNGKWPFFLSRVRTFTSSPPFFLSPFGGVSVLVVLLLSQPLAPFPPFSFFLYIIKVTFLVVELHCDTVPNQHGIDDKKLKKEEGKDTLFLSLFLKVAIDAFIGLERREQERKKGEARKKNTVKKNDRGLKGHHSFSSSRSCWRNFS